MGGEMNIGNIMQHQQWQLQTHGYLIVQCFELPVELPRVAEC